MKQAMQADKIRDLGSAKEGIHHWWRQRITSIALIPLGLWAAFSLLSFPDFSYVVVHGWFQEPWNTVLMLAVVIIAYYHLALGVRVILEDYIHLTWLKVFSIILLNLASFVLCLISIVAILKIFLL